MTSSDTRVVVTGLGATTPLGGDVATTWDGLLQGRSGVRALTQEWAAQLPVRIAATLVVEPTDSIKPVQARRLDRCQQVALVAAREAWADAGQPEIERERLAVAFGTGIGGVLTTLQQEDIRRETGYKRVSPLTVPMLMPNGPAAVVGLDLKARAGTHSTVSACSSGSESIALGLDLIRAGRADAVVVGGAEACLHPLPLTGFSQMRALSTRNDEPQRASRPFDRDRDGFVFGEGAAAMVIERAEYATARGARIYAEFAGAGVTSDAYDIVQPHPEGAGAARAISLALRCAGLRPADIQHVSAHATSTPVGDIPEADAIRSAIGEHPVVTAPKSSLGHLLGAAGPVSAIATVLAIHHSVIPPTINLDNMDERVNLDVATKPREVGISAAVSNSFGFGGHNVTLVFTRHA